jgi:hypothetical protein
MTVRQNRRWRRRAGHCQYEPIWLSLHPGQQQARPLDLPIQLSACRLCQDRRTTSLLPYYRAAAALSTGRSRAFLAAEAIEEYLDINEWQVAGIALAISSLEAIEDLNSLRTQISVDDPAAAKRVALHILHCVEELLPQNPQLGHPGRVGANFIAGADHGDTLITDPPVSNSVAQTPLVAHH